MGCGGSHVKKDTRSHSKVTVAAQQRAEAAYRRQRIALEVEQTAAMRAEMEVERARLLKGLSGDRRSSYSREVVDLRQELSGEILEGEGLEDSSRKVNEGETAPVSNGHLHQQAKTENEWHKNNDGEKDINRNIRGKNSFEHETKPNFLSDGDLLQIAENRSTQASPSNVYVEENEHDAALLRCQNVSESNDETQVPLEISAANENPNDVSKQVSSVDTDTKRLSIDDDNIAGRRERKPDKPTSTDDDIKDVTHTETNIDHLQITHDDTDGRQNNNNDLTANTNELGTSGELVSNSNENEAESKDPETNAPNEVEYSEADSTGRTKESSQKAMDNEDHAAQVETSIYDIAETRSSCNDTVETAIRAANPGGEVESTHAQEQHGMSGTKTQERNDHVATAENEADNISSE